jgi:hypothetical protein
MMNPKPKSESRATCVCQITKNMEQEIECPRCYDVMTLSSDFDRLGYFCQECDLLFVIK